MAQDRRELDRLMDLTSSGDDEAFGALAGAVQDRLFRFALAHGLRHDDAADAVQETLLRAYRGRTRWKVGGSASAWLYGIAMNVVRERRRRLGRWKSSGQAPDFDGLVAVCDDDAGADEENAEKLRQLARAMAKLAGRQREAVSCRYLQRMSVRETAQAMGCAEGTVKAAVHAALRNLRDSMAEKS